MIESRCNVLRIVKRTNATVTLICMLSFSLVLTQSVFAEVIPFSPAQFGKLAGALQVVRTAIASRVTEAAAAEDAVKALPPQGATFALKSLEILLGRGSRWRSYREPRLIVLQKIASTLARYAGKEEFTNSEIHRQIGQLLSALLAQMSLNPTGEGQVIEIMDHGKFWSPLDVDFLVRQIEYGRLYAFARTILDVGRQIDGPALSKVKRSLLSLRPRAPVGLSLLYLLGLARESDKVELIGLFLRKFSLLVEGTSTSNYFPIGSFGWTANDADLSLYLRSMPSEDLSHSCQVTTMALMQLNADYLKNEPSTVAAMTEAVKRANQEYTVDGGAPFFRKLTTLGFAKIKINESSKSQLSDANGKVVYVDFLTKRRMDSCENRLR